MRVLKAVGARLKKVGYLVRATLWAAVLGIIEMVGSERGRRVLGVVTLVGLTLGFVYMKPIRTINPGEVGVRVNRLTGHIRQIREGWAWVVPRVHELRRFPLRDQIYRPQNSARATGETPSHPELADRRCAAVGSWAGRSGNAVDAQRIPAAVRATVRISWHALWTCCQRRSTRRVHGCARVA